MLHVVHVSEILRSDFHTYKPFNIMYLKGCGNLTVLYLPHKTHSQMWSVNDRMCNEPNTLRSINFIPVEVYIYIFLFGSCFPKQFTVGFSLRKKSWPRYALAASPEPPNLVRLVSALIPLWPRLHALSAMCPPCVRVCPLCRQLWSTPCPRLWTLSACCGAGPRHHEEKNPSSTRMARASCVPQ